MTFVGQGYEQRKMSVCPSSGRRPWFDINPLLENLGSTTSLNSGSDGTTPITIVQDESTVDSNGSTSGQNASSGNTAFVIGIAGGSASGKTSVSEMIIKNLDVPWVVLLSMDSFYKALSPKEIEQAHRNDYNFDHPNAFDYDLLFETLTKLKAGKSVQVPIYDFKTHSRLAKTRHVYGANVIVFEGIFGLYDSKINNLMDLKLFVDTDDDTRLVRRLKRDISERGRDMQGVLRQYHRFVKPMFDEYIRPTMRNADIIIPRGADNIVAIELITKHIARLLDERTISIRSYLAKLDIADKALPETALVMPMTPQLKYIHTMIRNRETEHEEFNFFADRLGRLVVEFGLSQLPFEERTVCTRLGFDYSGLVRRQQLCGVSIVRAGIAMELPLRTICQDIPIGRLLIQTDQRSLEPQLHYCKLPSNISECHVLLMEAVMATGAAVMMAIRVLLDHDVPESSIIVLSMIATPQSIHALHAMFPDVRVCTSEIDWDGLTDSYHVIPGIGNFGDRYFGTD